MIASHCTETGLAARSDRLTRFEFFHRCDGASWSAPGGFDRFRRDPFAAEKSVAVSGIVDPHADDLAPLRHRRPVEARQRIQRCEALAERPLLVLFERNER